MRTRFSSTVQAGFSATTSQHNKGKYEIRRVTTTYTSGDHRRAQMPHARTLNIFAGVHSCHINGFFLRPQRRWRTE
ncbi:hypothetical protein M404DRAFT_732062 [Pisolithus tinctorius Marx 270]|uniref:Uncharacterized protein n=1 Tax=Pisolithus tinctorius Marx 270 TaxID=870435 RepID=A0A0C3P1L5_PISTI|nr:hypothetical protein M404DRAFT_732062 [Pisolithus tinctorius Marx 270]